MPVKKINITNQRGLHARASAKFVNCAREFSAKIMVSHNGLEVPATSVMGLMMLVASKGSQITLSAEGDDAEAALTSLEALISSKFGEE